MKHNLILRQNIPYARLIYSALDLCETMLSHASTLYPFAVLSIDNDIQCVFSSNTDQEAQSGMIEELELQLCNRRLMAEDAIGILVYAATVAEKEGEESDAIVFSITDSAGRNTITIYPYQQKQKGIALGRPFTCDFGD